MEIKWTSEYSIMFIFEKQSFTSKQLINARQLICQLPSVMEVVIGYQTLTVYFDNKRITHAQLTDQIQIELNHLASVEIPSTIHHIPVCYDPVYGLDLAEVSNYHRLTTTEIIKRHTEPTYQVIFLGFSPGFPFLSGLDESLATPRKNSPRTFVSKGAVGIAGSQTGIYPIDSPGGWQIIGQTPLDLLTMENLDQPTLLSAGDQIKFYPISKEEYQHIVEKEQEKRND